MSILVEDSPRNLLTWINDALIHKTANGAIINPFASPRIGKRYRRAADMMADDIRKNGGQVWFDSTSHALQMPGVGDFRYYDEYDLWGKRRGDLTNQVSRADHIKRVFNIQNDLGAPHLAPTVLLHYAESAGSQKAVDFAKQAMELDSKCWLSVVGTGSFWSGGGALDAYIGALVQLQPAGWFLTVARPDQTVPVQADPEEVHGLCRTVCALSDYGAIHISYGDLAALPAVAAGATSIGSGWDQRQRVCSYASFIERDSERKGGGWYLRPTFHGLLGILTPKESELLARRDPSRAMRLGPPPPPGPKEAFLHHLSQLKYLVDEIADELDLKKRYQILAAMYGRAASEWPYVNAITGGMQGSADWIDNLANGLHLYAATEGW